ncbi:hypothetical protein Glove_174g61 [Diversispora epigaea]|uniref:Uncharacterized protein n=1 Tax=Diversispora epigaea TaxID=1348612 RepID=A0A397IXR2_9GLOM|nr:hypothetical protein Glove_174g61 [Diversispora epigaea]
MRGSINIFVGFFYVSRHERYIFSHLGIFELSFHFPKSVIETRLWPPVEAPVAFFLLLWIDTKCRHVNTEALRRITSYPINKKDVPSIGKGVNVPLVLNVVEQRLCAIYILGKSDLITFLDNIYEQSIKN